MPELSRTNVDGTEMWYACLAVAGQTYRRILGAVADMDEEQAMAAMEKMRKAATPTVIIQDVTFGELAAEWSKTTLLKRTGKNRRNWVLSILRRYVLPVWEARMVRSILTPELFNFFLGLEKTAPSCIASSCRSYMGQIFRYGIMVQKATVDPTSPLKESITRPRGKPWPTILDPQKIGQLMRDLEQVPVLETRLRILLQAYTFTRSGECRFATWDEIDMKKRMWTIPSRRMKMRREHTVPLAPQVIAILRQLKTKYGFSKWLFPSLMPTKLGLPMSVLPPLYALRALGYDTQQDICLHGFRSMACSTLLETKMFSTDAIELQLAHVDNDRTHAAYHRSDFWEERVKMMEWWARWLDSVKHIENGAKNSITVP